MRRFSFRFHPFRHKLLPKIFFAVFLIIFFFYLLRLFRPSIPELTNISPLQQCPSQQLANLYQLHSLASAPLPRPNPLNWLDIHLSRGVPSPNRRCPTQNANSPFSQLFAIVHSHLNHFANRQSLRRQFRLHKIAAIFVLSSANSTIELMAKIENEAKREGDLLVLANLAEGYRLIAHKTRAWIGWLSSTNWASMCRMPPPKLLLKMDDDLMVNWPALGRLVQRVGPKPKRMVLCRTFPAGQISRNPKSKWFLSADEFPVETKGGLGLYCQGLGLLISWDLLANAAANLRRVQFLWMDDWYLSHALLTGSNATFVDISPHIRNVEMPTNLKVAATFGGIGPIPSVHYPPIFAHFRPANKFSDQRKQIEWTKMLMEEGKRMRQNQQKCSL